jgi:hypothetical protein
MTDQKLRTKLNVPSTTPKVSEQQIEAARYAVLRRLAPCLRHNLVRPLQPIGLIYGVMSHKLEADTADLQSLRTQVEKINGFAKSALSECNYVGTWLSPEPGVLIELKSGVKECVGLLATMLHFCGFRLENEVAELPVQLQRDGLRMILIAALLELTDSLSEPATVTISATVVSKNEVDLDLQVSGRREGSVERYDDGYRKLIWSDVQALAAEEDVKLSREEGQVTVRFAIEH